MALIAPDHLRGNFSRWTPQALRDERMAWALARAAEGWTCPVGALGIAYQQFRQQMYDAGWRWWHSERRISNPRRGREKTD